MDAATSATGTANAIINVGLVGCRGVGKTTISNTLRGAEPGAPPPPTTLTDCAQIRRTVERYGDVDIIVWDTRGMDANPQAQTQQWWRKQDAVVIVYDITTRSSFENVEAWTKEAHTKAKRPDSPLFVVGNKSDLTANRTVTKAEGEECAARLNTVFVEVSALDRETLDTLVQLIVVTALKACGAPSISPARAAASKRLLPTTSGVVSLASPDPKGPCGC